jgi:hypothetical protein
MKRIITNFGEVKKLQVLMHCSKPTVWRALRYNCDNDLARRIRKVALDRGGKIYEEVENSTNK